MFLWEDAVQSLSSLSATGHFTHEASEFVFASFPEMNRPLFDESSCSEYVQLAVPGGRGTLDSTCGLVL